MERYYEPLIGHRRSQDFALGGLTSEGNEQGIIWAMGVPLRSLLRGLRERHKLPSGSRGSVGEERRLKRVLEHLDIEKAHLIASNLSYLTFLRHSFSHIHVYNYY